MCPRLEPLEPRDLLSYAVTDLGAYCNPSGLNESGLVVMLCYDSGTDTYTPAAWRDGAAKPLGIPAGATTAVPNGVNDAGLIVGSAVFPDGHYEAAFLGDNPVALGTFGGLGSSSLGAANNAGQVMGYYTVYGKGSRGFIGGNGVTDTGAGLGGNALSDDGQVAGTFRLLPARWRDGEIEALPVPAGGHIGGAYGISHNGHFIAGGVAVGEEFNHALRWTDGALTDLRGLIGQNAGAVAVNDAGETVGAVGFGTSNERAWLWDADGTGHDLNGLIPPGSGWRLTVTLGINDAGQVIGRGTGPDGRPHGYLLTPDAGPGAMSAWLGWALGLPEIARRV